MSPAPKVSVSLFSTHCSCQTLSIRGAKTDDAYDLKFPQMHRMVIEGSRRDRWWYVGDQLHRTRGLGDTERIAPPALTAGRRVCEQNFATRLRNLDDPLLQLPKRVQTPLPGSSPSNLQSASGEDAEQGHVTKSSACRLIPFRHRSGHLAFSILRTLSSTATVLGEVGRPLASRKLHSVVDDTTSAPLPKLLRDMVLAGDFIYFEFCLILW